MKIILAMLITLITLQAQNFTKRGLMGTWEVTSSKMNRSVGFGEYYKSGRNSVITLLFNPSGMMKIVDTGDIYNYEVINGKLKIYDTKVYKNNYKIKRKNRYDLFKIVGSIEGCKQVKIVEKKIPGYKSKNDLKMCKTEEYPRATYQRDIKDYKF